MSELTPPQRDVEQEVREAEYFRSCLVLMLRRLYLTSTMDRIPTHAECNEALARFESAVRVAALREAHDSGCHCHHSMPVLADVDGKCISSVGGLLCGQPISLHEHTDPRCERLRAGNVVE